MSAPGVEQPELAGSRVVTTPRENNEIKRVVIYVAMKEEAMGMIESLKLSERVDGLEECSPSLLYEGEYAGGRVGLVIPGTDKATGVNLIGTDSAALTTYLAVRTLAPDLVINAGTCGGFKRQGGSVGDVYCVTGFQHHDRRIPIPGYDVFGRGHRAAHNAPKLIQALNLKTGLCSTGNSLDFIPADDQRMLDAGNVSCKDMEAASIAWVADILKVPLLGIKVVTDVVDGDKPTQEEFLANLGAASASLQAVVPKVLDFVLGRRLDDL